jgi:glycosyltransferase AglD
MSKSLSHPPTSQMQPRSFHWPRFILLLLIAAVTIAALLWLGGGRETLATLGSAKWSLVALAVVIHYAGFALRGHRWQQLLAGLGHRLPYRQVTALLIAGWFVSALVPARAGDLARISALRLDRQGDASVPVADALGSIVLERTLDITAILGLGAAFGFAVLQDRLPQWVLVAYGAGVTMLLLFGVALLAAPGLLARLYNLSERQIWQRGMTFAAQLVESVRSLLRRPGKAILLSLESALIWLCDALLLWLVLLALGQEVAFAHAAFIALTVDVFATVPLTPGGMGQIELAYTTLLSLLALPVTIVPAAVLLVRAIAYWSFLGFSGVVATTSGFTALIQHLRPMRGT